MEQFETDGNIWTTILVKSIEDKKHSWHEYRGFGYSIGAPMPGASFNDPASRQETNLNTANMLIDSQFIVKEIDLSILGRVPDRFQDSLNFGDYFAAKDDINLITAYGCLSLYVGDTQPTWECKLDSRPIEEDKAGNFAVRYVLNNPILINRIVKFWCTLHLSNAPIFGIFPNDRDKRVRGTMALRITLTGDWVKSVSSHSGGNENAHEPSDSELDE